MTEPLFHEDRGEKHRIVFIEYSGKHPNSVITTANERTPNQWDFDWCVQDELLIYHRSGGGGRIQAHFGQCYGRGTRLSMFWADPIVKFVQTVRRGDDWATVPISMDEISKLHEQPRSEGIDPEWNQLRHVRLKQPLLLTSGWGGSTRNPFEAGQEGSAVWCRKCDSMRLEDGDHVCEHLYWCGTCGAHFYTDTRTGNDDEKDKCDCTEEEIDN